MEPNFKDSLKTLFGKVSCIGALDGGGVTRLGYSDEEDEMHRIFRETAESMGLYVWEDRAGNSFASNMPEGTCGYTLIGSHLDSVVEGGEYDGVVGVFAGLLILRELKAEGFSEPVTVAAFRCEESSNFKICTIGSGLITGGIEKRHLTSAIGRDGKALSQHMSERGFSLDVPFIKGIKKYLEIHIEQGRVLEDAGKDVGVVTAIAAPHRYVLTLEGLSEHSGATPMKLRKDALCAASEIILRVESIGREESLNHSVATVGAVENHPNVMNAVPGFVKMQIDMRGIDNESICRMEDRLKSSIHEICDRRDIKYSLEKTEEKKPVLLDRGVIDGLSAAARQEGISYIQLPSGAGHDAMSFAPICPSGMVFIPCRDGISHNIHEYTEMSQIETGMRVVMSYLTACQEKFEEESA